MPKKGLNIYKRKDGRWEGRYIKGYDHAGKARYASIYAHSYSEAKLKTLDAIQRKIDCSLDSHEQHILFDTILDMWLASKKIAVKESSYAKYYHLVKKHISPVLGRLKLSELSRFQVEQAISKLLACGRLDGKGGLSARTVSSILAIVKSAIEFAKDLYPSVNCTLSKTKIKNKQKEMRVLSIEEQHVLNAFLLHETDLMKLGVLISLYTGLRIGEICALKWEHIDFEKGVIQVRQTIQRIQNVTDICEQRTKVIITEPKSDCSIRDVPIPTFLFEPMQCHRKASTAFVLTGKNNYFVEPRTMQNQFSRYLKACGIASANYHSLRHSFATRCVELGFEIKSLSEILGHSNVNTTLNRYVHSSLELKKENMSKLSIVANY